MKKYSILMAILLVFAMILPGVAQAAPVVEAEEVNSNVIRLSGADRIKTSVKVSQTAYKDGAESVVIVGYEGEVDALAGTLLAHAKKGPVLFTKKGKLSEDTKTEIARLGAKNVYILGGTAAIEDAVKTELETLKYTVKRISGSNREGTAAAVTKEVGGKTTHVFLARGYGDLRAVLSDALAVGPASAKGNMAVLLTRTDKVPAATLKSMKDLGVTNVTIVGGEGAVNSGVKTELETLKYTVDRLSGTTREGTAIAIANKYFAGKANALVANGYGSPDALVGGYLGAAIDAPILFSQANKVSEVTTDYLKANTEKAWILGGEGVVNKEVLNKVLEAVDVKVKESITVTETTKLNKDYKSVKVTGNDIVVDLNGKTVETLTVTGNDTIIKNGTIVNIIVGKDVVNVTLEDIIDDGDGNHEFEGGGAESIILKGSTQLKSKIEISSTTPIQIRTDNLGKGKGITGKVTINTEAAVTIAAPVSELEVKKENKNIKIKAEVGKISALADANITVDKDIKMPTLEKAAGIKATATDSSGKEHDFKENDKLEPTTPVVPTPTPPSTGGESGDNVAVSAISVDKEELTLTAGGATGTITATVSPAGATNKNVTWTSSNEAVATVVGGVVTPLTAGTTTITATTVDGGLTATITINVIAENTVAMIGTTQYTSLQDAVGAVIENGTASIKLVNNVTLTERVDITSGKSITLDLNGKTISKVSQPIRVSGGTLNVTGTGIIEETDNDGFAPIVIKGSSISTDTNYSNVTIGENVTLKGWAGIMIDQLASDSPYAYGVNVTFNGTIISPANASHAAAGHGIYVNGNIKHKANSPVITIGETAKINTDASISNGIYAAGYANWTIEAGAVIKGATAIEIKAGKMTINGGTFTATQNVDAPTHTPFGNGTSTSGYALAAVNNAGYGNSTENPLTVEVNGGTFNGAVSILDDDSDDTNNSAALTINGGTFTDLPNAVKYAADEASISLAESCSGAGIFLAANEEKNITIDFGGKTYTITSGPVGSTGYETQGLHLEKGNTVTLKNGTITSSADSGVKMLVQKYCDLTLENMVLDGTKLSGSKTHYVLSNNNGTTTLTGTTTITAAEGDVAFDVYYWPKNGYKSVTVEIADGTVEINGRVEYAHDGSDLEGFKKEAKLTIPSGYNLAAPTGYKWVDQDGKQVLSAVTK